MTKAVGSDDLLHLSGGAEGGEPGLVGRDGPAEERADDGGVGLGEAAGAEGALDGGDGHALRLEEGAVHVKDEQGGGAAFRHWAALAAW